MKLVYNSVHLKIEFKLINKDFEFEDCIGLYNNLTKNELFVGLVHITRSVLFVKSINYIRLISKV